MVEKVYIIYTNEKNARVAGVFLSKEVAKRTINSTENKGQFLDIEPEEWALINNLPYTEEEIKKKTQFNLKLVGTIDGIDYIEVAKIKMKKFIDGLTDSMLNFVTGVFNNNKEDGDD